MSVQSQIRELWNLAKALKSAAPISASKVKTYLTTSQAFSSTNQQTVRIKFTPSYTSGGATIASLHPKITSGDTPLGWVAFVNEPQDGTGAVVIKIQFDTYSPSYTYTIRVYAFGTSPGTFSML